MVLGIGIDIIEIHRIEESLQKFGKRFLDKLFTPVEQEYCMSKKNKAQHLAARFAAKEAIAKALSTGWAQGFRWQDIEIYNEPSGMPKVKLFGELKKYVDDNKTLQITMSHSDNYVTCFAILHKNG